MTIQIATSDADVRACYPVMRELRPQLVEDEFLARVRRQEAAGYQLVCVREPGGVVAVAGFRIGESLSWGRFLYVDDLVTLPAFRSRGQGARLLAWLKAYAAQEGCRQLHLDSGIQRKDAHRFYEREGMTVTGLHFAIDTAAAPHTAPRVHNPGHASDKP
jgi:GNAT superfamily N-acetyltransferase